ETARLNIADPCGVAASGLLHACYRRSAAAGRNVITLVGVEAGPFQSHPGSHAMRVAIFSWSVLLVLLMNMAIGVAGAAEPAAAKPVTVTGKVDAVTVYRGEAMVTRLVDLGG